MSLTDALSRTLLLMRTDLNPDVPDEVLVEALTAVRIVLKLGEDALATHSGQSAAVTAALTMARSGHDVWIDGADVAMVGAQPPLRAGPLIEALVEAGADLLPGRLIHHGCPTEADLMVLVGAVEPPNLPGRVLALDATDWSARMLDRQVCWSGDAWPIGGIVAGGLVASEAFRIAMRALAPHARDRAFFDELYAPSHDIACHVALPGTPTAADLPHFDFVSGGAIANAALFTLSRLPGVSGTARVLDDDMSALSNLNRNALLRRSALDLHKVVDLAARCDDLAIQPEPVRYVAGMPLAETVLVGVDDIASRWAAQAAGPDWLGVGATEGFSVLVSSHGEGQACAGCLHPVAAPPTGPIPTAAFVSLLSGVFLVARWLRSLGPEGAALPDQQSFLNALRPEGWNFGAMPVAPNPACPVGCTASGIAKAA